MHWARRPKGTCCRLSRLPTKIWSTSRGSPGVDACRRRSMAWRASSLASPKNVSSSRITAEASFRPLLQSCSISVSTLLFPELFGPTKTVIGAVAIDNASVLGARPNLSLNAEIISFSSSRLGVLRSILAVIAELTIGFKYTDQGVRVFWELMSFFLEGRGNPVNRVTATPSS
jgi:hypothetical protein